MRYSEIHLRTPPRAPRLRVRILSPAVSEPMPSPIDTITSVAITCAINIHRRLGPGLLESVYESLMTHSISAAGLHVQRQVAVPFVFDGIQFDEGFRLDLLVENMVVIEVKSIQRTMPVHSKQLLTYLRLSGMPVGLLLNFGAATLKEGLHRIVNDLPSADSPALRINRAEVAPTATDTAPSASAAHHCPDTTAQTAGLPAEL